MLKIQRAFSGFSVPDIAQAKNFYTDVLSLKVTVQPEGLKLEAPGAAPIFIYPSSTNKPADYTILNFVVDDIEKAVDELNSKGVPMEQYDTLHLKTEIKGIAWNDGSSPGPKAIAWFKDPAGNIMSLIQEK